MPQFLVCLQQLEGSYVDFCEFDVTWCTSPRLKERDRPTFTPYGRYLYNTSLDLDQLNSNHPFFIGVQTSLEFHCNVTKHFLHTMTSVTKSRDNWYYRYYVVWCTQKITEFERIKIVYNKLVYWIQKIPELINYDYIVPIVNSSSQY